METYNTDEQQVEAVKQWWKENGLPIITGLVIGLGGIFGWRGWQAWEQAQAESASDIFQDMIHDVREKDHDGVRNAAKQLLDDYATTTYAVYAALNLARLAVQDEDFEAARDHLEYASDHAVSKELRLLSETRLARVMLMEGKLDEALNLLNSKDYEALGGVAHELKGDILVQKGDLKGAMSAYTTALAATSQDSDEYELLTLKLDSVSLSN
ncbi:MAG: tetratricopeptide repeat protein [Thiotrichales bacterium]|nr:tetratricopeptide repeat protein [Thiotrichales bacterium]